jgi:hypothetical protein
MTHRKADAKPARRTRLSRASRLLGSALRGAVQIPIPEAPWWNKKQKDKTRGKR